MENIHVCNHGNNIILDIFIRVILQKVPWIIEFIYVGNVATCFLVNKSGRDTINSF